MKIHLIMPPSPFLLDEKVFMSLGILKIAAVLEPYYDVNVIFKCDRNMYVLYVM